MQDPSQGIQRELLPHVHLLSTYRFPHLPQLHPEKVGEWLLGAPKIARDQNAFYWTYLDRPTDGSILLVWQAPALGTEFASDGYVWGPMETAYQVEIQGGYVLEMHQYKQGYGPNEPLATHARRRYRLLPPRNPNGSHTVSPDPSLWIVHYTQAEPQDRVRSEAIPVDLRIQDIIRTRAYLHAQGQIVQKEFALNDRANWPQIAFPAGPPRRPNMYPGHAQPQRIPQHMAYPPSAHAAGPPSKRPRPNPSQGPANSAAVAVEDDDEDTSRGDYFDAVTPRQISVGRFQQNHEWMEEVVSSPYSLNQIMPVDLGLGLRGGLSSLTAGIFEAPVYDEDKKDLVAEGENRYVGRLDPKVAEDFRKRATEQINETNEEIEKMKAKHAKRLAKFQKGSLINNAELLLREAVNDPTEIGPEYWRLEGKIDDEDDEGAKPVNRVVPKVDDIVAQVEASVGRHAAAVKELIRIQDGGFEEAPAVPTPQPAAPTRVTPPGSNNGSQHSGVLIGDADMDMSNSVAGLLDQYHNSGMSSNATPGSIFGATPIPHLQAGSSTGTPNINMPSPQPPVQQQAQNDTQMADTEASGTAGDWVVVPPGGVSPQHEQAPATTTAATSQGTPAAAAANPSPHPTTTPGATSSANTPGIGGADFHTSPNDFADLGDLDTAGEALAGYGDDMGGDNGGLGDMMDVGMDDSAFGDAFHGVEPREGEDGDGLGDGL